MQADQDVRDQVSRKLHEALDRVRQEIEKVDIWAGAFAAFVKPVAEYPMQDRFLIPARINSDRRQR